MKKDYSEAFFIEGERGNNAFSYAVRGDNPRLFVPSVCEGTLQDVQLGEGVVFEDEDEFGVLQSCQGLKSLVRTQFEGVPMVIMDNHNHAFYFWMEAYFEGHLNKGATLIHVDQHRDSRRPPEAFTGKTLEDAFDYTNFVLNVGNYIVPAQDFGLVGEEQCVMGEADLVLPLNEKFDRQKILNVDLDFFAPEMDYISFQKAKQFILAHAKKANLITVCTSPFFIDQHLAIQKLHALFGVDPC